jgi:TolB-like protein
MPRNSIINIDQLPKPETQGEGDSPTAQRSAFRTAVTVRFREFRANLWTGEVFKRRRRIHLQEKPFQILKTLLEHHGEMVTREELRRKLWSTDVFVDFDRGLKTAISKLRRALGDSADRPRLVETLPGRGYRFVAPVESPSSTEGKERNGRVMLAVLSFKVLSADAGQEYLSEGMTDEVISQLGRLHAERLGIIARTSVTRYKQTGKSLEQIGQELNVDHILEGSIRISGRRMRLAVQLVHLGDQAHIWADCYDRRLRDVLALQIDVAHSIARQVAAKLNALQ